MSLINCPECSKMISDKAAFCPNCGNPITNDVMNKDSMIAEKERLLAEKEKALENILNSKKIELNAAEIFQGYEPKSEIICPHCQKRGYVITRHTKKKRGVSGGKATGALLTGGLSLFVVGLSRKEKITEAKCKSCEAVWTF